MGKRDSTLVELMMLNAGIAPVDVTDYSVDPLASMRKMLDSLSPEDRRIASRKFRKQWKKAYRQANVEVDGGSAPSRTEMRRRIWMVYQMFADDQKVCID